MKRPLSERVGSAFENGYGDEGVTANVVYGLIMAGVFMLSVVLAPVVFAAWLWRKLISHRYR